MAEEFLAELEACALPPQPKKLFDDDVENDRGRGGVGETVSATPAAPAFAANIELGRRINNINIDKQKKMNKSSLIVPSSAGMVSLGRRPPHEQRGELISRDEVQNWKAQVLSSNRPRNQWGGLSNSEAALAESRQYARSLAALNAPPEPIEIRTEGVDSVRCFSGSDEDVFPSPPQEHEHQRHRQPHGSRLALFSGSSLKPASSTSAAVTPPESDKYSDYSSASSNKSSASPPQTSPNPLDYSLSASAYHRPSDLYRTAPAEVYRSAAGAKPAPPPVAKKTVSLAAAAGAKQSQQRPLPYHTSLRSQTRTSNSDNFNPLKVPVDPFGYVWQPSTSKTEEVAVDPNDPAARGVFRVVEHPPADSSKKPAADNRKSTEEAYGSSLSNYSKLVSPEAFRGVSSTTPPLMTSSPKNAPKNAAFSPTFSNSSRQPSEASSVPSSVDEARRRQRWRELADAADDADRAFAERRARLQAAPASAGVRGSTAVSGAPPPAMRSVVPIAIGDCALCHRPLTDSDDTVTTESDGRSFHDACFACSVGRRQLRDRHYHSAKGRLFCEEDFEYTGRQKTTEKCAKCGHPIVDTVLQALGRYFHPACFRCIKCRVCLDGIPFALDSKGEVYCMADYHALYAPRCAACTAAILPDAKTGETVRVVAINNDYHVECYVCEGCKVRLTDESTSRCFPLGRHLLCYDCHVVWRRTGGDSQKITDL